MIPMIGTLCRLSNLIHKHKRKKQTVKSTTKGRTYVSGLFSEGTTIQYEALCRCSPILFLT